MQLIKPFKNEYPITQTFAEHVQRAKSNGWCYKPGTCPGGVYYYGGTDYGTPIGTAMIAAHRGELTFVRENGGYGINARIKWVEDGNTCELIYGHLSSYAGVAGSVEAGEIIGFSGNTGNSKGPHLHFELRINGIPVDATAYMSDIGASQPPIDKNFDGELPALGAPVYAITLEPMNIRLGPSTDAKIVGVMPANRDFVIIDYEYDHGNLWAVIGGYPLQYIAMYHNGRRYVEFIE